MDLLNRIPLILSILIFIIIMVITKLFRFSSGETLIRIIFLVPIFYVAGYILRSFIERTSLEDSPEDSGHPEIMKEIEDQDKTGDTKEESDNEPLGNEPLYRDEVV